MHAVRDLLDQAITDRNGRDMGRVDRVVVDVPTGSPPRIVAIEVGASALGQRFSPTIGRWTEGLEHALGVDQGQPLRIHVHQILGVTSHVKVDLAFGETPAANVERKLRALLGRLPGATR
jgi:sporulation protein YlmC with PRC-barrel domain